MSPSGKSDQDQSHNQKTETEEGKSSSVTPSETKFPGNFFS
jgi:hypothetical protein